MSNLLFPCYQRATFECGNFFTGLGKAYVCSGKRCDNQRLTSRAPWSKYERTILLCLSLVKTFWTAGIEDIRVAQCSFSTSRKTNCFALCLRLSLNTRTTPGNFQPQHKQPENKRFSICIFDEFRSSISIIEDSRYEVRWMDS